MRKLIKKILRENEWDWVEKIEPKLTKGLILCPNHERFSGGCKEVFKVDEVIHEHAPDRMVYLKDLENGNRYADTMKDMMQWLSDGDYVISFQPLKESNDFDWVKDVKVSIPFDHVKIGTAYTIDFIDGLSFIRESEKCGVNNAEDIVYDTYYVIPRERMYLESRQAYCGDENWDHFEGQRPSLELSFYNNQNKLINSSYWVVEGQEVEIRPY